MRIVIIGGFPLSLLNFRGPLLKTFVDVGHEVIACAPDAPPYVLVGLATLGVR